MRYPRPFRGRGRIANPGTHTPRIARRGCSFVGRPRPGALQCRPLQGGIPMTRGNCRGRPYARSHKSLPRTVQRDHLHEDIPRPESSRGERSHNFPAESSPRSECLFSGTLGSRVTRDGRSHYHSPYFRSRQPGQSHGRSLRAKSNELEHLQGANPLQGSSGRNGGLYIPLISSKSLITQGIPWRNF
ncbi:hypothetical protein HOLleu_13113 [Holothuria leucospilota]|uniref:Uncharacterized protein n=1 Tax=Holothuria leucospilota TaxID=206669 RepID=A0A9Q1CCN8_HOLLE|nr:hypothetical protein HOLleu_13113 [Holothuria leucospilota]